MDVYSHEKEQIENIKAWWRENRWYIIAGLVISAAIVGGWRYWQAYQVQQAEAASIRYEAVLMSARIGDNEAVQSGVEVLRNEYARTPYAALASLRIAALQVEDGDYAAAADALRWAMDNTRDSELALVARHRLARVLVQQGDTDGALQLLSRRDAGRFQPLFDEVRGDALLASGDRDAARAAYETALENMTPEIGDREQIRRKMRNVDLPQEVLAGNAAASTVATEDTEAVEADTGDTQE